MSVLTAARTELGQKSSPFDRDAERAVIGSSLLAHYQFERAAAIVDVDDFWLAEHRRLFAALDDLADVGRLDHTVEWDAVGMGLCTPPVGLTVRCAAAATIADLPLLSVRAIALLNGDVASNARRVAELASRRRRILDLEAEIERLLEPTW